MAFRLGSLNHAKGFAINKLFDQHCFGAKHVSVDDLMRGYHPEYRALLSKAIEELAKEGIIVIQTKKTGRGTGDHAFLMREKLGKARPLLNGFREAAGFKRYGRDLQTLLPVES